MSITILKAGFHDLIQDLGRNGYTHMGISPTGAADNLSFRIGNLLLGNNINMMFNDPQSHRPKPQIS